LDFEKYLFFQRGVKPGTLIADCSTIDPEVSKEMAVASQERNARFLDSPVSGGRNLTYLNNYNCEHKLIQFDSFLGVMAAKAGTLTFMVGGPKVDFEELQPLLLHMGAKVSLVQLFDISNHWNGNVTVSSKNLLVPSCCKAKFLHAFIFTLSFFLNISGRTLRRCWSWTSRKNLH